VFGTEYDDDNKTTLMYSSTLIETRLGYFGDKVIYQLWICMIGWGLLYIKLLCLTLFSVLVTISNFSPHSAIQPSQDIKNSRLINDVSDSKTT
jgi:hypothetical protein